MNRELILTKLGQLLIDDIIANGGKLEFLKVQSGSGLSYKDYTKEQLKTVEDVEEVQVELKTLGVKKMITATTNYVRIDGNFSTSVVERSYVESELGVIARVKETDGTYYPTEDGVLYCYRNVGGDGDYIPNKTTAEQWNIKLTINVFVDAADVIEVEIINGDITYQDLLDHITSTNPHYNFLLKGDEVALEDVNYVNVNYAGPGGAIKLDRIKIDDLLSDGRRQALENYRGCFCRLKTAGMELLDIVPNYATKNREGVCIGGFTSFKLEDTTNFIYSFEVPTYSNDQLEAFISTNKLPIGSTILVFNGTLIKTATIEGIDYIDGVYYIKAKLPDNSIGTSGTGISITMRPSSFYSIDDIIDSGQHPLSAVVMTDLNHITPEDEPIPAHLFGETGADLWGEVYSTNVVGQFKVKRSKASDYIDLFTFSSSNYTNTGTSGDVYSTSDGATPSTIQWVNNQTTPADYQHLGGNGIVFNTTKLSDILNEDGSVPFTNGDHLSTLTILNKSFTFQTYFHSNAFSSAVLTGTLYNETLYCNKGGTGTHSNVYAFFDGSLTSQHSATGAPDITITSPYEMVDSVIPTTYGGTGTWNKLLPIKSNRPYTFSESIVPVGAFTLELFTEGLVDNTGNNYCEVAKFLSPTGTTINIILFSCSLNDSGTNYDDFNYCSGLTLPAIGSKTTSKQTYTHHRWEISDKLGHYLIQGTKTANGITTLDKNKLWRKRFESSSWEQITISDDYSTTGTLLSGSKLVSITYCSNGGWNKLLTRTGTIETTGTGEDDSPMTFPVGWTMNYDAPKGTDLFKISFNSNKLNIKLPKEVNSSTGKITYNNYSGTLDVASFNDWCGLNLNVVYSNTNVAVYCNEKQLTLTKEATSEDSWDTTSTVMKTITNYLNNYSLNEPINNSTKTLSIEFMGKMGAINNYKQRLLNVPGATGAIKCLVGAYSDSYALPFQFLNDGTQTYTIPTDQVGATDGSITIGHLLDNNSTLLKLKLTTDNKCDIEEETGALLTGLQSDIDVIQTLNQCYLSGPSSSFNYSNLQNKVCINPTTAGGRKLRPFFVIELPAGTEELVFGNYHIVETRSSSALNVPNTIMEKTISKVFNYSPAINVYAICSDYYSEQTSLVEMNCNITKTDGTTLTNLPLNSVLNVSNVASITINVHVKFSSASGQLNCLYFDVLQTGTLLKQTRLQLRNYEVAPKRVYSFLTLHPAVALNDYNNLTTEHLCFTTNDAVETFASSTTVELSNVPDPLSLLVKINGMTTIDYSLVGKTITFTTAPAGTIECSYTYSDVVKTTGAYNNKLASIDEPKTVIGTSATLNGSYQLVKTAIIVDNDSVLTICAYGGTIE